MTQIKYRGNSRIAGPFGTHTLYTETGPKLIGGHFKLAEYVLSREFPAVSSQKRDHFVDTVVCQLGPEWNISSDVMAMWAEAYRVYENHKAELGRFLSRPSCPVVYRYFRAYGGVRLTLAVRSEAGGSFTVGMALCSRSDQPSRKEGQRLARERLSCNETTGFRRFDNQKELAGFISSLRTVEQSWGWNSKRTYNAYRETFFTGLAPELSADDVRTRRLRKWYDTGKAPAGIKVCGPHDPGDEDSSKPVIDCRDDYDYDHGL